MAAASHNGANPKQRVSRPNGTAKSRDMPVQRSSLRLRYIPDLLGDVRVERLRLARRWHQDGADYQAIGAYADMMLCYTGTPAATAAAEELLEMAIEFEQQGRFYAALDIFRKVEHGC